MLFHSRERGDEPLIDTPEARRKGWARLVMFASYLRPEPLEIPSIPSLLRYSFQPGLRSARAHFGIYPFQWQQDWKDVSDSLMGVEEPRLQVAPVLERLVLPRARKSIEQWLEQILALDGLQWLVPAHYSAPLRFTSDVASSFLAEVRDRAWAPSDKSWTFLGDLDQQLLERGVVPKQPL